MRRIDTPTAQKDKWGAGKNGYTNGDPAVGIKSTALNAEIFDSLQEEICNVIEKFGVELDPENNEQLWNVINNALNGFVQNGKLVESMTDTTTGRIPVVGWMGLGGAAISLLDAHLASKNGFRSSLFRQGGGDIDNHFGGYGAGAHILYEQDESGYTHSADLFVDSAGNLSVQWTLVNTADGTATHNLQKLYGPLNKPTAADVGALSINGGTIHGPLVINHFAPIIELCESDTGKKYFIVADGKGFRINEDSTGGNEPLGYNGGSNQLKTSGQFIPGDYANFDARYQSKGSYSAPNAAYKAANGYWQCASTGMIFQWAQGAATTGTTDINVTFPRAFPSACFMVSVSTLNIEGNAEAEQLFELVSKTNSGCTVKPNLAYGSKGNVAPLIWAVGY